MVTVRLSLFCRKLRLAPIGALALVLVYFGPTTARAQRYLTEIVVSTTNLSVSPIVPPQLKFGAAINAFLLVDGAQVRSLMDWFGNENTAPPAPINVVLSTSRAALDHPEARALLRGGNLQIIAIAVSPVSLGALGPQDLVSPRRASLVGVASPRDLVTRHNVGKGQLRF